METLIRRLSGEPENPPLERTEAAGRLYVRSRVRRRGRSNGQYVIRPEETPVMETLGWLAKHRLESVLHREHDWLFTFDRRATLAVECLWRLVEAGRIRLTSEDDGQRFGLPAPVVAAEELGRCLIGASVISVTLRNGTLDLELRFDTGHALELIPTSAGYEAWQAMQGDKQFIAVGGGELAIFDRGAVGA